MMPFYAKYSLEYVYNFAIKKGPKKDQKGDHITGFWVPFFKKSKKGHFPLQNGLFGQKAA